MLAAITAQAAAMTHCAFPRGLSVFSLILGKYTNLALAKWSSTAAGLGSSSELSPVRNHVATRRAPCPSTGNRPWLYLA